MELERLAAAILVVRFLCVLLFLILAGLNTIGMF